MYKPLSLVLLLATLTGCQSVLRPADYDDPIVGFQCMLLTGKKPLEWDQIHHIQRYAGYGNARCMTALGILYENGGYGLSQDFDEARRLFTESAKANPPSNYHLGRMAERGEGEPVDLAKAREFYRLSGKTGAVALGQLMEKGEGGPKDPSGALTLYLDATNYVGDEAWQAIRQLRKQGQPLDAMQKQRFQQQWLDSFIRLRNSRLVVREVFDAVNATGAAKKVTLSFRFSSDSGKPQVTLLEGSGDANVDHWIMEAASRITMREDAPLTDDTGELKINSPLTFPPRRTERMFWMCGTKPCAQE